MTDRRARPFAAAAARYRLWTRDARSLHDLIAASPGMRPGATLEEALAALPPAELAEATLLRELTGRTAPQLGLTPEGSPSLP